MALLQQQPSSRSIVNTTGWILLSYLLFGALHELSHIICAYVLGIGVDGITTISLVRVTLGRQIHIGMPPSDDDNTDTAAMAMIRHAGWISSCLLALMVHASLSNIDNKSKRSHCHVATTLTDLEYSWETILIWTAYATALESLATDLFQFTPSTTSINTSTIFYCGNFGLIILNPMWREHSCDSALAILKDMIRVTMMRGAQSGGVVTFDPASGNNNASSKATRSRVVNMKRTDLSEGIIAKVKKDNRRAFRSSGSKTVKTFSGHTRFATTSVANFDGTHPHRWSPQGMRSVYDFTAGKANLVGVENYVMHNGDFEFYDLNGMTYDLEAVQDYLIDVLCCPMPSMGDSCAIAGLADVMRTKGCFSLSARYALVLGMPSCAMGTNSALGLPKTFATYEKIGDIFDQALQRHISSYSSKMTAAQVLAATAKSEHMRVELNRIAGPLLRGKYKEILEPLVPLHLSAPVIDLNDDDEETGTKEDPKSLTNFTRVTIDAFFDNDLMQTTKEFLANANGSFGLCIASTLDASSQMCLAARGQTMSVAFYPKSGLILYGSEQAAVKGGLNRETPGGDLEPIPMDKEIDDSLNRHAARLDLDDLGGEICLLDWSTDSSNRDFVSQPNRHLEVYRIMNGTVRVVLYQQNGDGTPKDTSLFHRMTLLEGNAFIEPLKPVPQDVVLSDIQSIPRVCHEIQKDWQNEGKAISFNRLTALTLSRSLIRRLDAIAAGRIQRHVGSIDILLTGCEVSLWLAEQLASDLKKAFTKLNILAVSSNKVLGLFGQEQSIPAIGFPISRQTHSLTDSIVVIVSHSGGTFGPLQCSNLLQSVTRNIFAVTSEWDCQVGKQLRSMYNEHESLADASRLFTTGVGLAPAEPCSLSVAATQQLLTNIFEHMCIVGTSSPRYRHVTGATITERDLQILERCNRDNIQALEAIVGVDVNGKILQDATLTNTMRELRAQGDTWSEHVLENAKAYMMSFIYIVFTVTTGWPLFSGIGDAAGAARYEWLVYLLRFLDSLLYFWLPQVNILILRIIQGRNIRHRMTSRTVVIGDIPWVAQCAEAFLSKLFACSYSIAGLNVHSANPADHLVHRFTHRVMRGTLLVCGRPDGRLMALTSLESSVLLSVSQASSIQSFGGRCESVTIGHNPFDNPLCYKTIFLERFRPLFLCERLVDMTSSPSPLIPQEKRISGLSKLATMLPVTRPNASEVPKGEAVQAQPTGMSSAALLSRYSMLQNASKGRGMKSPKVAISRQRVLAAAAEREDILNLSRSRHSSFLGSSSHNGRDLSRHRRENSRHGRNRLIGHNRTNSQGSIASTPEVVHNTLLGNNHGINVDEVLAELQLEQIELDVAKRVFDEFDANNDGYLDREMFLAAYKFIEPKISSGDASKLFEEANLQDSGELSFEEFLRVLTTPQLVLQATKNRNIRDHVGLVTVKPSEGKFFDDDIYQRDIAGVSKIALAKSESLSMELYEGRIASLQRFVSMTVMFHQMGHRVQSFFRNISFGFWGYRMDRTHSIMRVATTASPASGAHVRKQMEVLRVFNILNRSAHTITVAWFQYKTKKIQKLLTIDETAKNKVVDSSGLKHDRESDGSVSN